MNKICKCKYSKSRIIGNAFVCTECNGIIAKVRKQFYRRTRIKPNKKKYNRTKLKEKLRKEIDNVE